MTQCKTKYTTLLDLSRQAKIITGDTACFDGKIQAGIPFSGYPTGVDLSTVVETGIMGSQNAMLSGNTVTTIFDVANPLSPNYSPSFSASTYSGNTWTNPVFSANTSYLTLPITPLSADSQTTPITWTLTQTGMTGDYVIGTEYTGYSVTYSFFSVEQDLDSITGRTYATEIVYSAQSLDYKGPLDYISSKENITVENRLTTKKLQVTNGADASTIGYVLKQSDSEGNVEWGPDSSGSTSNFTGNTAADCIDEFWVNNISGCTTEDLNIGVSDGQIIAINSGYVKIEKNQDDITTFLVKNNNTGVEARSTISMLATGLGGVETTGTITYIGQNFNSVGTFQGEYLPNSLTITTGGGGPADRANINIGPRSTTGETRFFSGGDDFEEATLLGNFSPRGLYVKDKVGIGTLLPEEELHVAGDVLIANPGGSSVLTISGSAVSDAIIDFDNNGTATPFSRINGQTFGAGSSGNLEFYTNPGGGLLKRMTVATNGKIGIGDISNNDIEEDLHIYEGELLVEKPQGRLTTVLDNASGPLVRLSADSSDTLVSIGISSPNRGGISIGARGLTDVLYPGYGKVGDGYIYSSNDQNGINIISSAGAGLEDYIRMYAGQDAVGTADLYIQGTGATRGFVGIHNESPTTELDVDGDVNISGSLTVGSQVIGNTTTVDAASDPNVNGIDIVFYTASLPGGTIYLNSALNQVGYKVKLIRTSTTAAADISGSGGALVNGAAAKALPTAVYSTTTCVSDGTDWYCSNGSIL